MSFMYLLLLFCASCCRFTAVSQSVTAKNIENINNEEKQCKKIESSNELIMFKGKLMRYKVSTANYTKAFHSDAANLHKEVLTNQSMILSHSQRNINQYSQIIVKENDDVGEALKSLTEMSHKMDSLVENVRLSQLNIDIETKNQTNMVRRTSMKLTVIEDEVKSAAESAANNVAKGEKELETAKVTHAGMQKLSQNGTDFTEKPRQDTQISSSGTVKEGEQTTSGTAINTLTTNDTMKEGGHPTPGTKNPYLTTNGTLKESERPKTLTENPTTVEKMPTSTTNDTVKETKQTTLGTQKPTTTTNGFVKDGEQPTAVAEKQVPAGENRGASPPTSGRGNATKDNEEQSQQSSDVAKPASSTSVNTSSVDLVAVPRINTTNTSTLNSTVSLGREKKADDTTVPNDKTFSKIKPSVEASKVAATGTFSNKLQNKEKSHAQAKRPE